MKTNCDRSAGSPSEIIRRHAATLRGADAQVPCAGCTACCYHARIPVDPKQERPASLRLLDLVADTNGHRLLLRKRADGACVHLGPDGCTVYEHRPRACRGYDCRAVVIFGPGFTRYDATHYAPAWTTTTDTDAERAIEHDTRDMVLRLILAGVTDKQEAVDKAVRAAAKKLPRQRKALQGSDQTKG